MKLLSIFVLVLSASIMAKEAQFQIENATYLGNKFGLTTPIEINCKTLNSKASTITQADILEICFYQENLNIEIDSKSATIFAPNSDTVQFGHQDKIVLTFDGALYTYTYKNNPAPYGWAYQATHNLKKMENGHWIYQIQEIGGINAWGHAKYFDSTAYILKQTSL